ncbi:hypothetical protein AOQ84DRAFT_351464 [Glonium stellatum]|uniref:Uncharacterized protein n=1 Tax=Glonium stellatum TaxID=574774 RepID=A0A8E2JZ67_9PEZI|nr:hypothetical protein AOQ84DRAFT_351464 [Glonium stellatum]
MPAILLPHDVVAPQLPSQTLTFRSLIPHLSALLSRRSTLTGHASTSPGPRAETLALAPRAVTGIIPTYYNLGGPGAGATVGIVLGSVAGFFLILWLFYALSNTGGTAIAGEQEIVVRRRRSRSPHSRRSRRSTHTEVREVSRSPRRREHIIVEERRERPRSILVEERRVPGDDVVEVIEEHSDIRPPRRDRSRRNSAYRY